MRTGAKPTDGITPATIARHTANVTGAFSYVSLATAQRASPPSKNSALNGVKFKNPGPMGSLPGKYPEGAQSRRGGCALPTAEAAVRLL